MIISPASTIGSSPALGATRVRQGRQALLELDAIRAISAECAYNATALAQRLGISMRQLQRLFTRQTGCSPRLWLREERLQAAHRLLLRSSSVKEVALTLSFRQASQFCRDFRTRFGYTPSTLHRSQRCAADYSASAGASAWALPAAAKDRPELGYCAARMRRTSAGGTDSVPTIARSASF
jgi:AraC-like DNA-binding protein